MRKVKVINIILIISVLSILGICANSYAHTKDNNWGFIHGYPPHSKETKTCFYKCIESTEWETRKDDQSLVMCYLTKCNCVIEKDSLDLHCCNDYPNIEGCN